MIETLAALFLGSATISDLTRQDRARIMMGQWRKLFSEHELGWGAEIVHRLFQRETEDKFVAAQAAWTDVLYEEISNPYVAWLEDRARRDYASMLGKIVYPDIVTVQMREVGGGRLRTSILTPDRDIGIQYIACRVVETPGDWIVKPSRIGTAGGMVSINPRWRIEPVNSLHIQLLFEQAKKTRSYSDTEMDYEGMTMSGRSMKNY